MKRILLLAVAFVTALALASPAGAGENVSPESEIPSAEVPTEWVNETPTAWFVQLGSPPAVRGTSAATLAREKNSFRWAARRTGLDYTERMAFDTLFNGFSIEIDPGQLGRLADLPQVKAIYPVLSIPMPATTVSGPDLATAIQMTGADVAQSELGYTGAGVKVAVMDTGIDYDHPDLGGCFGEGCRVETGWDFVGDAYNADSSSPSYDPIPAPDPYPDDCQGHGTHVSGIVGANGDAVGVAPGVTFGAYRVFGCDGSTEADIMIAAMEMALEDGMDVLNMSIGSAYTWPRYPTALAANYLVDQGMVVVASIGNSGASGTFSAGAPGLGNRVIGVAAFENTTATFPVFEVGIDDTPIGYNPMAFSDEVPIIGTEEIVFVGRGCDDDLPLLESPTGKIALIERGECSFAEKAQNAYDDGATAVVVHNNNPGNFNGTLGAPPSTPQIVVSISLEDGLFIRSLAAPWMLTWTDQTAAFPNPSAGLIASFSSYGLAPDLSLKPDIGAPGGNIYSTYPLEKGGYANMGGTSMSAPHVAGAAALLLEARPDTRARLVRDILQNSADPVDWWGWPGSGFMEPVHRQGAGMVDIDDAILQDTVVTPGKLSLRESEASPHTARLRIYNNSDAPITYTLSTETNWGLSAAIATTGTFADELGYWLSADMVDFSTTEITVRPGRSKRVRVTVYPEEPGGAFDNVQYGGWITVMPDDGSDVIRVPYAGFIGDYQSLEVLTPGGYGVFPSLGWTPDGIHFGLAGEGSVFTMEGFDVPNILLHLHHQSRMLTADIYDVATGEPVHPEFSTAFEEAYLPRNSSVYGFFAFPWDGTRIHTNQKGKLKTKVVPDGEYYIVVRVLKALGDPEIPEHWETWTSPMFVIDRP